MNPDAKLVVFGASNFLSDIFDAAIALGLRPSKVVLHLPETPGERDRTVAQRIERLSALGIRATVEALDAFQPASGELYILGPTTPARHRVQSVGYRRTRHHRRPCDPD